MKAVVTLIGFLKWGCFRNNESICSDGQHIWLSQKVFKTCYFIRNLIRLLQCSVNIQWTYVTIFSKKSTVKKWLAMLPSRNTSFPSGPLFCWTSSEISLYSATWRKASNCYILTALIFYYIELFMIWSNIISTWPIYPFFTCTCWKFIWTIFRLLFSNCLW